MSTRIYTYGLPFGPEEHCREQVDEQIWLAHRYQNRLVELERDRRAAFRATIAEHSDEYATAVDTIERLEAELSAVRDRISERNRDERSRTATDDDREIAAELKSAIRAARKRRRAAQKEALKDEKVKAAVARIDERANDLQKLYRYECGVYWGTYLLIEEAMKAAKKSATDPHFVRWRGRGENGRVGVQIQGGASVDEVVGGDSRLLQIDPVPDEAWNEDTSRGDRRRMTRTTVRIRIGSQSRKPVWAEFKMILHRPLPEGARIKRAWIKRRREPARRKGGRPRYKWELQITLQDAAEFEPVDSHQAPGTAIGLDIGWRMTEGLRVVYVARDDDHYEIRLPDAVLERLEKVDELRGTRDAEFNSFRALLVEWMSGRDLPEWMREEFSRVEQWRSCERMRHSVRVWRDNRVAGDEDMFALADAWRVQDVHLHQWESEMREKAINRRREFYRLTAKRLCERNATIAIEDVDLSQLARRAAPEDVERQHGRARNLRKVAALSELRGALDMMAPKSGTEVVEVPSQHTTSTCHRCGEACEWDQAILWHTCEHCSAEWDQDHNAARNLLKSLTSEFEAAAE